MLVVPEVDADFTTADIAKIQPVEVEAAQQLDVDLLCTGCPFAIQSGDETSLVSPPILPALSKLV
jgi:hypothetical protein